MYHNWFHARLTFHLNKIFPFAELQDILPSIIHQLGMWLTSHQSFSTFLCVFFLIWDFLFLWKNAGPDNLENLKKLAEQFQKQAPEAGAGATTAQEDDDDVVPDLVPGETFETVAEETKTTAAEETKTTAAEETKA